MKNALVFGLGCILLSCHEDQHEVINLRVNHFQQTAVGEGQTLVYLVQAESQLGSDEWSYLYSSIYGFDYELGYRYDLRVLTEPIKNPPADGSSQRYELVEILSQTPVEAETRFEIRLKSVARTDPPSFVFGDPDRGYTLLGELSIDCDTLCDELSQVLSGEDEVTGEFVHQGADSIRLTQILIE